MSKAIKYALPEVARMIGVRQSMVRYAAGYKGIVKPRRIGHTWIFNAQQVEVLRQYFALDAQGRRHYGETAKREEQAV